MKFIIFGLVCAALTNKYARAATESELTKMLMRNYVKSGRPVVNVSEAVKLTLGVTLQEIKEVNIEKNELITNIWMNLQWKDELLSWVNKKGFRDFEEIDDIRLPWTEIWTPDVLAYNSIERFYIDPINQVVIYKDGSVTYIPPFVLKTTCKIDTTWFPFDEQNCDIKFGSWTFNGFKLDVEMASEEGDLSTYVTNDNWELIGMPGKRNEVIYECCPEPYLDITYTLKLKRRTGEYISQVIIPQYLFAFICILSGIIPSSLPLPRILVKFLMIILICGLKGARHIPSNSVLALMIGNNFLIMTISLLYDVIMIAITHVMNLEENVKKQRQRKILWFVDLTINGIFMLSFLSTMSLDFLTLPYIYVP